MKQNLAAAEIIPGADARVVISLTSPSATAAAIRALKLDVLLDFSSWQRLTAFYALMSGAKFTAGFRTRGMHRSRGYDMVVDHTNTRHELENFRALLAAFLPGVTAQSEPAVKVEAGLTPFADQADVVVFHPWASGQNSHLREWAEASWLALAQEIAGPQTLFVVTGAPADMPRVTPFVAALRGAGLRAEPYVSPDGFRSLTALLLHAKLTVSVNTGVMHLAAVAGAPVVSLNGPTAEHRWGARGAHVRNVQPADGSGGYLHLGFEFGNQPADIIDRITVAQVVAAAKELR